MPSNQLFDVRILDRNLQKGLITREQYDKHLAELADIEGEAVDVEARFVEGVLRRADEEE